MLINTEQICTSKQYCDLRPTNWAVLEWENHVTVLITADTKIRHRVDLAYVVSKNCIAGDQFSSYAHLYGHLLGEDLCVHHGTRRYTSVPCELAVQSSEDWRSNEISKLWPTLAFSIPAICCRFFHSCIFHSWIFARIAFSIPALSVAPLMHVTARRSSSSSCRLENNR